MGGAPDTLGSRHPFFNWAVTTRKRRVKMASQEEEKRVVLEEARLNLLGCDDDILRIEYEEELRKLERLLDVLMPDTLEAENA